MSAIAGWIGLDGAPADPAVLGAMLAALGPYGDAAGRWIEGPAALGAVHRPATPGADPGPRAARGAVLAADVRLDDRPATARALGLDGPPEDDADLLTAALERWGDAAPDRVLGDFALAAWRPTERRLLLARDPLGVRPLYVAHRPGRFFAFASSVQALLAVPGVGARLDEDHVADYLRGRDGGERTFWAGVRRLPAGHVGVVEDGRFEARRYWTAEPAPGAPTTPAACAEALREALGTAVRDRLRAPVPVGVALSGGLDSSSLAVLAREAMSPAPVLVFGGRFGGLDEAERRRADEGRYQDAVVETGGFAFHAVEAADAPLFDGRVETALEEHFRPFQAGLHDRLFAAARRAGVGVFFDGLDGDTVVSHGHERLAALAHAGEWASLERELAPMHAAIGRVLAGAHGLPAVAVAVREGRWGSALAGARWAGGRFGWRPTLHALASGVIGYPRSAAAPGLIAPAFARRVGRAPDERPAPVDPVEAHRQALLDPVHAAMLERAVKLGAAHGVDGRFPFYDRRVVALALAFPPDVKLRDGHARWVLREAMRGGLPETVRLRPHKADLTPAFVRALRAADAAHVVPELGSSPSPLGDYVDLTVVRAAHARLHGPAPAAADATLVYTAVALARGLRRWGLA